MTNREYLATLSNYDLSNYIYAYIVPVVGKSCSNSALGVAEWLGQDREASLTIGDGYVETTPKYATWILNADGFRCSKCGYKNLSSGFPGTCPNCNSKMGGIHERRSTNGDNY